MYVINIYGVAEQLKVMMECKNVLWITHVCTVHNKQPGTGVVLVCMSVLIVDVTVIKEHDFVAKKMCHAVKKLSSVHVSGTCTGNFVKEKQGCAMQ